MKRLFCLFALILPLPLPALTLVEDGAPRATIVLPEKAKPVEAYAARELAHHVRAASGAELPIVPESEAAARPGAHIYVGATRASAKVATFTPPERFAWEREKYPWTGRMHEGALYFLGVDGEGEITGPESARAQHESQPLGTLFAVYDFLENELGVRWIWPGPLGEVVPPKASLSVRDDYRADGMPRFINAYWRAWHRVSLSKAGWSSEAARDRFVREQREWLIRQRFRRLSPLAGSEGLVHTPTRTTHPGIVAMTPDGQRTSYYAASVKGTRSSAWNRVAMCVSNPDLPRLYLDYMEHRGKKDAEWANIDIPGVNETDIPGYCVCAECRAWDAPDPRFATNPYWKGELTPRTTTEMWNALSPAAGNSPALSDRYAKFWLATQQEAQSRHPGGRIWAYAYTNYATPPKETKLNENILVATVHWPYLFWPQDQDAELEQTWDGWHATGASLMLRPNSTYNGHGLPVFYARSLARAFSHAAANGLVATDFDTLTGQWGTQGPTLYTVARIHNHPQESADAILNEFYSAFGPAKEAVAAYFAHWEAHYATLTSAQLLQMRQRAQQNWETLGTPRFSRLLMTAELFPPAVVAQGRVLMDAATSQAQASGDALAIARVAVLDAGLRNSELTLAAVERYWAYVHGRTLPNRLALEKTVEALAAWRRANADALYQNLAWLDGQERNLWHPTHLGELKARSGDAGVDAD